MFSPTKISKVFQEPSNSLLLAPVSRPPVHSQFSLTHHCKVLASLSQLVLKHPSKATLSPTLTTPTPRANSSMATARTMVLFPSRSNTLLCTSLLLGLDQHLVRSQSSRVRVSA